jgi:hypothetical protein
MKILGYILLSLAALVALVFFLWRPSGEPGVRAVENLPWQIETLPGGGSKVFGITLGQSTIADVRRRFGHDIQVAVIAAPKETGALEAYYGDFVAGVLVGKLVLGTTLSADALAGLRERAVKSEYMQSSTRRYYLSAEDQAGVEKLPVTTLTFIPIASIDEESVLQRFGAPRERLRTDERIEHLLYPERGLDIALDSDGKEVLQYVAPKDFARLRSPLAAAAAARTGAAPAN